MLFFWAGFSRRFLAVNMSKYIVCAAMELSRIRFIDVLPR